MAAAAPPAGEVAHVALRLGRLMLVNGADTARVQAAVEGFVRRHGFEPHLLVAAEGLLLTLENASGFRTRLGASMGGMAVDMRALAALERIGRASFTDLGEADRRLQAVEHGGGRYPPWLVALGMGVTAAALARLFGGAWVVVAVSGLVGVATQALRWRLGRAGANPVAGAALAACGGGLVGAVAMRAFPEASPALCLVAAGMILVPGVPLLNGVRDTLGSHVAMGLARLMLGTAGVLAIALGLLLAAGIAGDRLPVAGAPVLLPVTEDFLVSALAGIGYALLFNVPGRAAWACMLCAMAGHGLRTALVHAGADLAVGSLAGALAATLLARLLGAAFDVPAVTFAFPGVVAMIPGAYAFRAAIGGLAVMHEGAAAPPALLAETMALGVTAVVVTAAIAIGLSLALAVPFPHRHRADAPAGEPR
jgi:uncharacterized membrane protein YjjP (DUF1212 family)